MKEIKRVDKVVSYREGNISLILDSYDDIFSDFDPRSYDERALSDDFLNECKKAARDKDTGIELRFLVQKSKRDIKDEVKIKHRLRRHFQKHYSELHADINKNRIFGIMWFILGSILMFLGTYFYTIRDNGFFFTFLFILTEPASWYFFWEGLNKVFFEDRQKRSEYQFYKKMTNVNITFYDY